MTEAIETTPAPDAVVDPYVFQENPAIARCLRARSRAYKEAKEKNKSDFEASLAADQAYRLVMPRLSSYENIRDFIACVTHGMLIRVIDWDHSTKLLYAAQVALSTVRSQPVPPKPTA
jgi:hypothetical protein